MAEVLVAAPAHRPIVSVMSTSSQRGYSTSSIAAAPGRADLSELSRRLELVSSELSGWIRRNASGATWPVVADWAQVDAAAMAKSIRSLIRYRRARSRYFPPEIFADPAWDILLDLTAARLEGTLVPISSLCIAAGVPTTTALRWIATLVDLGLLSRRSDSADRRRVFVELTENGWDSMSRFIAAQGSAGEPRNGRQ